MMRSFSPLSASTATAAKDEEYDHNEEKTSSCCSNDDGKIRFLFLATRQTHLQTKIRQVKLKRRFNFSDCSNPVSIVKARSPSIERGSLPQLLRYPSKESNADETRKKGKMITIKNSKYLIKKGNYFSECFVIFYKPIISLT